MSEIDRLFDDVRMAESDDVSAEAERVMAQARIANRQRTVSKQRKAANRARAKADAEELMRNGGLAAVFRPKPVRDATLQAERRPTEADAMSKRLSDQQRRQKLAAIRAQVDERFANFRKGFDD